MWIVNKTNLVIVLYKSISTVSFSVLGKDFNLINVLMDSWTLEQWNLPRERRLLYWYWGVDVGHKHVDDVLRPEFFKGKTKTKQKNLCLGLQTVDENYFFNPVEPVEDDYEMMWPRTLLVFVDTYLLLMFNKD